MSGKQLRVDLAAEFYEQKWRESDAEMNAVLRQRRKGKAFRQDANFARPTFQGKQNKGRETQVPSIEGALAEPPKAASASRRQSGWKAVAPQDRSTKGEANARAAQQKKPWAVGRMNSGSVLRKKGFKPLTSTSKKPPIPVPESTRETLATNRPKSEHTATMAADGVRPVIPKKRKKKKSKKRFPFDGQPRFEGGFRIVQGGLPESGR